MKVIDMHCDTVARLYNDTDPLVSLRHAQGYQADLEKLKKGGYLLQNFALFLDLKQTAHPAETALSMADLYYRELEKNKDLILPAFSYEDICANSAAGKMSALLTLEEGDILEGSLDNLHLFYEKGVRMIALTWNYPNKTGYPNMSFGADGTPSFTRRCDRGLTPFGIELVREMQRLGIIIDVSHMSDGGFWDILKYTEKPFVASHSNAVSVQNVCRNLTDDMIRALAERGGVMGLNFCSAFLTYPARPVSTIADMIRHIRHITNTGGIDVLGLGSDFDGISNDVEFTDASGIQALADALKKSGFSETDIEKIFYKNVMRLYHDTL